MKYVTDWRTARLVDIENPAEDVRMLTFAVEGALPAFDPGSHTRIRVTIGGEPATRSYTVLPSPAGTLRIAVKLHENSRGGSRFLWSLSPGDQTQMTVPENRFALSWRAPSYLLIAGGIGVTPIYGMAQALAARGAEFRVLYAARSRSMLAFADEIRAIDGDRVEFYCQDEGRNIDFAAEFAKLGDTEELYICGPVGMLNAAKHAWEKAGRKPSRFRYEVFGDSGLFAEQPFRVEIPSKGAVIEVRSDQSMLDALMSAGIDMIYDCQRGECGLCAVTILETETPVDHRDVFFSEEEKQENRRMCACVSRIAGGRAVIDTGYRP
ncbi:PDR/VanB family oxidoreductase [Rhizobium sp. C4]|uniref:PDR/VanB family oxidoreductase n=1 Tax=Rhizobium sp. C4 TaxID=1349800 RepID=UPI001E5D2713|nr:PDR/VanB family oxidoreductase [Rhizobium sp. C4]MCD2174724.1 PDR/VanB family oxidoreductase [Rhizobium sp. C4]